MMNKEAMFYEEKDGLINCYLSQYRAESKYIPPEEMAEISMEIENNIGLAFTYNEPSIWYEYVYDVARKIKLGNLTAEEIEYCINGE